MALRIAQQSLCDILFWGTKQWGAYTIGHKGTVTANYPITLGTVWGGWTQSTQTISNDEYNNGTKITSLQVSSATLKNDEQGGTIYLFVIGKT